MVKHRTTTLALAIAAATFGAPGVVPVALGDEIIEEVVVTGSRRAPPSVHAEGRLLKRTGFEEGHTRVHDESRGQP